MSDLINRQAAMDAIPQRIKGFGGESWMMTYRRNGYNDCVDACLDAIRNLPPAQPETEERTEKSAQNVPNDDLISRKMAIEELRVEFKRIPTTAIRAIERLNGLPPAQPDLNQWCMDCKEYDQEKHSCPRFNRVIREALKDAQPEPYREEK